MSAHRGILLTMAKIDPKWATDELDAFLRVTAQVVSDLGLGVAYFGTVMHGPETEASARARVVEQILDGFHQVGRRR